MEQQITQDTPALDAPPVAGESVSPLSPSQESGSSEPITSVIERVIDEFSTGGPDEKVAVAEEPAIEAGKDTVEAAAPNDEKTEAQTEKQEALTSSDYADRISERRMVESQSNRELDEGRENKVRWEEQRALMQRKIDEDEDFIRRAKEDPELFFEKTGLTHEQVADHMLKEPKTVEQKQSESIKKDLNNIKEWKQEQEKIRELEKNQKIVQNALEDIRELVHDNEEYGLVGCLGDRGSDQILQTAAAFEQKLGRVLSFEEASAHVEKSIEDDIVAALATSKGRALAARVLGVSLDAEKKEQRIPRSNEAMGGPTKSSKRPTKKALTNSAAGFEPSGAKETVQSEDEYDAEVVAFLKSFIN